MYPGIRLPRSHDNAEETREPAADVWYQRRVDFSRPIRTEVGPVWVECRSPAANWFCFSAIRSAEVSDAVNHTNQNSISDEKKASDERTKRHCNTSHAASGRR